ncbi:PP2C family protein-serine/threonine phosphatase [Candidatus Symbiobacter mobilis]|uniref:Serine/threonine protein phosphatase n=1 Tax=Candidatus Symbiobacter mobilis CR TaxID=946483 RepID=U5N841_9BURK|nr:protein phosphatase 2C domain-containing protein [Candidatus Symbiobacter mobilis]AGX87731.1 serine/threonine protein phosphatase [Candidatus Symbiobacter mobilis CR]
MSIFHLEERGNAAVAWRPGVRHAEYADRYRLLCAPVPLVVQADKGEVLAVCDGVGSAPRGTSAAQEVCDALPAFYRGAASAQAMHDLLLEASRRIHGWGWIEGTDRPLGACAATVLWVYAGQVHVFHAGDTSALLIRDGQVQALTHAHQSAEGHLVNYIGHAQVEIEVRAFPIEEGDRLVLMSDGITKVMYNQAIAEAVESAGTRKASLVTLMTQALAKGATDDVTVVLMDIE